MSLFPKVFAQLSLLLVCASAQAANPPLLQTGQSWDGGALAYPDGEVEITSVMLRIEEGQKPPFHCHPMPTMGYVLSGVIEVETANGQRAVFKAGESVVEVMRTVHRGIAIEAPVEIVVFYAGAKGLPTTLLPDSDEAAEHCSQ